MTDRIYISGMTCTNCQTRIENALRETEGVKLVKASFAGGYADVEYDADIVALSKLHSAIRGAGYLAEKKKTSNVKRAAALLLIIIALFFIYTRFDLGASLPDAQEGMGYGMLLVIGLLTSVHCTAMCGGICLTQTMGNKFTSGLLYNAGRVVSYTVVGAVVGAVGSVITFGGAFRGIIQIIAGVFMVIMGINMLGIFPFLRKLTLRFPALNTNGKSPIVVGLLNGLMPCGPLQAMQLYALSTGSAFKGALSMFIFSIGTVPLMFGLGALSSVITKKFTRKVMTVGAVLVTVLGLTMFTQGTTLSGFSLSNLFRSGTSVTEPAPTDQGAVTPSDSVLLDGEIIDGVRVVNSTLKSSKYPSITVQVGVPVKWIINAPSGSITSCNRTMFISEYGIQYTFKQGENVIEFTPTKTGTFKYYCSMVMKSGTIKVV